MPKRYLGNIITDTPTEPAGPYEGSAASGVWSIAEALSYKKADQWPTQGRLPPPVNTVAPVLSGFEYATQTLSVTTGTWTGTGTITYSYQWYKDGSTISGQTSSSYTTVAADEGSVFYCEVTATDDNGSASADSNSTGSLGPVANQQIYSRSFPNNTGGSFSWVAPAGVTSISVVAVGGGGLGNNNGGQIKHVGGGGGGLGYRNNITVVPGNSYTVTLGATITFTSATNNSGASGGDAVMFSGTGNEVRGYGGGAGSSSSSTGGVGGSYVGAGGGNGGNGGDNTASLAGSSGGGAGGYSGNGGNGASYTTANGTSGSGGGGGGGGYSSFPGIYSGAGGGGVGLYGEGASGAVGTNSSGNANPGKGGSGGGDGGTFGTPYGGNYGGGSGGVDNNSGAGGSAVRIVWPGNLRQFPSTNVENF